MTDNEFHEQICKHILLCKFSDLYKVLTEEKQHNSDCPIGIDLYEPIQKVGIEVTEANLDNTFNKAVVMGLKERSYEDNSYITSVYDFGCFSVETKNYNKTTKDKDNFIYDRFIYALENKNSKYDEHYSEFNADLFIHDLLHMNQLCDIQNFIDKVLEYLSKCCIKFRYVYYEIFSIEGIIIIQFDIKNKLCRIEHIANHEMEIIENYTLYKDIIDLEIQKRLNKNS